MAETENKAQIDLLFDYTKFHIGLYSTFATGVLALLAGQFAYDWQICDLLLGLSLLPIAVAGISAGVIASSLPHLYDKGDVRECTIGPYRWEKWGKLKTWTYWEHIAFWLAILMAVLALTLPRTPLGKCCIDEKTPKATHVVIDSQPAK